MKTFLHLKKLGEKRKNLANSNVGWDLEFTTDFCCKTFSEQF